MARRRPHSFQAWALGLIGTIITALVLYYGRVAVIEEMGQRQIAHTQTALQKLQQQAQRQQQRQAPPPQHQRDSYDAQVMQAAAESQRLHDAAWESF